MKTITFFIIITLLGFLGCNKDSKTKRENGAREEFDRNFVAASSGTYYGILRPVNFYANGFIPYGSATFKIDNDQLKVDITLDDDQAVPHRQSLHIGTKCPSQTDDTNGDGFIDYDEALRIVGQVVMPLDSDLNSQSSGQNIYLRGPAMSYNKTASLTRINSDLWATDENPADNVMKLDRGLGLGLEGRVILVHGTSLRPSFPTGLSSHEGEPAHLSLPIVCGILEKVE